jgi:hypothetical protein
MFPKCRFDGYANILYFERNTRPIINLFFLSKNAKPILRQSKKNYHDICYCLKIIYIYGTWNSYNFFPNADLMDMRKFYILNGILDRFLICFFYLKRRNLSLDNLKRITTIYLTVCKLFTYTGLEVIKKLCPNTDFIGIREYCISNEIDDRFFKLFLI